ncbi:hypothetical protein D918_09771 [Trichuris suis]|nr:hypothetical protein M513_12992 [Trichuris suis]KHJ40171.1 hypothetical protein D918_09771 [Trichuris suis]
MAKTKLASLETVSLARLELQYGLIRAIEKRRFWTDSSCVQNWIRSSAAYYKPYVNHRIRETQTITYSSEWRFVPGRLNVSDRATRTTEKKGALFDSSWFYGPEFLCTVEDFWPPDFPWMSNTEEMRPACE